MSKVLISDYTFDASAKTIAFNDYGGIILENVLLITNVTDNIIIYNFAGIGKGGTVATNVLTLDYDTTTMDDADDLQIWYWDETISGALPTGAATSAKQDTEISGLASILAKIITAPATEAKQDTLIAKDFATQTTLAAVLAKIIAAPATEATLATLSLEATQLLIKAKTDNIDVALSTRLKPADTLTAVTTVGTITNPVAVTDNAGSLTVDSVDIGAKADASATTDTGTFSLIALFKRMLEIKLPNVNGAGYLPISIAQDPGFAKAEDAASGNAHVGIPAMAVRKATPANTSDTDGDYEMLQMSAGRLWASVILEAGSAIIGKVGIDQTTPGTTNAVRNTAGTTGGATPYKLISAASTNATSVKASAGTLYGIQVYNINAAARYLKLYNKASAPTVGTDTPVKVITIPGNTAGAGSNVSIPSVGVAFGTGLAFAITTGAADSDTGAVAASEIVVNLDYN